MKLSPDNFEQLQVAEFNKLLDGYLQRQRDNDRRQSYFTAYLMSALCADPVKPDDIYYGLHPEEQATLDDEREQWLKAMGLPSMRSKKRSSDKSVAE